ncbi:AraC family transcriptional regulator [Paractinoplanes hotanensis]|uniref:AraC family transcriptional regulator n=1 Tax=Paractinoplanes hotanensis TaxID=2906497 RepID=A0ABT0XYC3_9ACTN|nr:AraC family transcriptional regulator [Actinoplanes hotanensis]MCM4078109.1 AraC family transcriptional regulator [Actinoplanes hotanensis]
MDLISETIGSVRVGRVNGRRITEAGPYGLRLPATPLVGFHVMVSGEGWLISGDAAPVALRPGDVVFVAGGVEHGVARMPCTLAELPPVAMSEAPPAPAPTDFEFLCGMYPLLNGRKPAALRHLPDVMAFTPHYDRHPELRAVVDMLSDDYTNAGPGSGAARAALIDLMIVHILRHLHDRWPLTGEPGIGEALRAIHEQPARPWTVQQLGDLAGMSRSAFTRRFTAVTGTAPMGYLTDWRLDSGARLLRETTEPLTAIARRIGYATPFAFTAAFRRRYGLPPGRYRAAAVTPAKPN